MKHPCINRLERHLDYVPALFVAIDEVKLVARPAPSKWSNKEIMGHLVDSALYNLQRFTKVKMTDAPLEINPYPQAALVKANDYQNQPVGDILGLWESLNRQILSIWKNYTEKELSVEVSDPKFEEKGDMSWWIEDYTGHMEHHLAQIFGALYSKKEVWLAQSKMAKRKLAESDQAFVKLLEHGSMYVEYYAPEKVDLQKPHQQDELYVIESGSGFFYNDGLRHHFSKGDVLFVPAGIEHRFEQFSDDFATWVIFYGPSGGE